ncbi:AraC family transcriptional regulator [Clostridium chromiireducens]|uniref:AraC family transcriptional regulator n=1 Tax=Clostridium chromiireducens TaxID=225345 RepID=A0A399ILT1_9CLOT|nr:AraC family transcriptional regulator [Clostridium chromiireducens]RII34044.1 AraC family transcriptional regulator [Clostridium chromiireducens]
MSLNSKTAASVINDLLEITSKFQFTDGFFKTNIPFLSVLRAANPTEFEHGFLNPQICILIQGNKKLYIGNKSIDLEAENYIASNIDMPISGYVSKASNEVPYIAIKIEFTSDEFVDVALNANIKSRREIELKEGACVGKIGVDVLLVIEKLLKFIGDTKAADFLAPAMKREIIYYLLTGEDGDMFYNNMLLHNEALSINKAINYIKSNYKNSLSVEEIARVCNMSMSTLYHKFKVITTLSPIQYQKQLRLQEARRILLSGGVDVTRTALEVGYESMTQFNREYKRLFGLPPLKDIKNILTKASIN